MNQTKSILAAFVSVLTACGSHDEVSEKKSLRTPQGFYQNIWEYKVVGSDSLQRSMCTSNWPLPDLICGELSEQVPVQKVKFELTQLKVTNETVNKTFNKILSQPIDYVRMGDLEIPPDERLASAYLDTAFLKAGRGLAPTHLNHRYTRYLEVYNPQVSFNLTQKLVHTRDAALYTYDFYFQDGRMFLSSDLVDAKRETCRLSSVVKQVEPGLWKLKTEQSIPSLRLTFERGDDVLWLSCGLIVPGSGQAGSRETTSSGLLASFNSQMGTYLRNFSVVR